MIDIMTADAHWFQSPELGTSFHPTPRRCPKAAKLNSTSKAPLASIVTVLEPR